MSEVIPWWGLDSVPNQTVNQINKITESKITPSITDSWFKANEANAYGIDWGMGNFAGTNLQNTTPEYAANTTSSLGFDNSVMKPLGGTINSPEANKATQDSSFQWFGKDGAFVPVMQGVNALSNLYFGSQQLGLAQDAFNLNKGVMETNLANQAQLANNEMRDRYLSRLAMQGVRGDQAQTMADAYMRNNSVSGQLGYGSRQQVTAPVQSQQPASNTEPRRITR